MKQIILFLVFGSIACHFKDKARQIYVGTALSTAHWSDAKYKEMAAQEFNCLTGENEMKWDAVEGQRGHPNYGGGDTLANFAKEHGMKVRGHTLVWHAQYPSWVGGLKGNDLMNAMKTHITNEVTHYKGIYAWDVCNEIFEWDGTLRKSIWKDNFGESFVAEAFKTAHEADPNAKLYINDFSIEGINPKSTGLYNLVKKLKAEGVPIHGVGFQSHLQTGNIPHDMKQNLQRFADLGVDVALTELDITLNHKSQAEQAKAYQEVFQNCLGVSRCVGVTIWGFIDKYSWINKDNNQPCPWDSNYQPKSIVAAIEAVLK